MAGVRLQALILPFFNDLVGFIGAIGFWPLTVCPPPDPPVFTGFIAWGPQMPSAHSPSEPRLMLPLFRQVYFPIEMHIVAAKVPRWGRKWCALQALSSFTFCISLAAAIGSIAYVVEDLKVGFYPPAAALSAPGLACNALAPDWGGRCA